jgi:hypothetical protein
LEKGKVFRYVDTCLGLQCLNKEWIKNTIKTNLDCVRLT